MDVLQNEGRFQILSLDGGGVRGVFTVALLAAIEEDHHVRIVDHFDLIAGTSTGGIIAIALGLGLRPKEIMEFYTKHGPQIFSNRFGWRWIHQWFYRKYPGSKLREALRATFKDRGFGESTKRLVIPSYDLTANDVYLFRTPHLEKLRRDYRVPAWKVAMATAAAPTYFPVSTDTDHLRLVDGGVWANNPSLVALVEAVGQLKVLQENVRLLSIGTVSGLHPRRTRLNWAGKLLWASPATEIILDASSIGVSNQARFLLGDERYLRVNPVAVAGDLTLDGYVRTQELIARAAHASRPIMPRISKMFLDHKAHPYRPFHSVSIDI